MKNTTQSLPQRILAIAGSVFLLMSVILIGLVIYFVAVDDLVMTQASEEARDPDLSAWWHWLGVLELNKKPIVFLLLFVVMVEFGVLFLGLSCLNRSLIRAFCDSLRGWAEGQRRGAGYVFKSCNTLAGNGVRGAWCAGMSAASFMAAKFSPLQLDMLFLGGIFWWAGLSCVSCAALGVFAGSLLESRKS